MIRLSLAALGVAALPLLAGGCASLQNDELPVCDGRHRRPAHVYGSVRDAQTPPVPETPAGIPAPDADPQPDAEPESLPSTTGGCA